MAYNQGNADLAASLNHFAIVLQQTFDFQLYRCGVRRKGWKLIGNSSTNKLYQQRATPKQG